MSEYPSLIFLKASPIACDEVAQAVVRLIQLPLIPNSIAILPAAILEIAIGIVSGDILFGPLVSSILI